MNLISVEKLSFSHGIKTLFKDISFGINEGQKIALIGVNGCGKSTLLKMISGKDDRPANIKRKKGLRVTFLEQLPTYEPDHTILEHIFNSDSPLIQVLKEYEHCCSLLQKDDSQKTQDSFSEISNKMDQLGAWEYENEVASILSQLGINDLELKMDTLSGGMLKKVALAQVLLDNSDILILDEPTNHLDIETIQWLEQSLQKINRTVIMVTHDRYFLDTICNSIYEIDKEKLIQFDGNYSYYLQKKAEMEYDANRQEQKIQSILRTELKWLNKRPQARATKQKARQDRAYAMLDRDKPVQQQTIELGVASRRLGNKILELTDISKSFGNNEVIKEFSYKFSKKSRIGIVGPNGSGKSTFLNLITENIKPDSGEVDRGVNTHFGYFDQHSDILEKDITIFEFFKREGNYITLHDGSTLSPTQLLEKFLFNKASFNTKIGDLSGGEKRRLHLVWSLLKNPNFLIFDEPTNDLDVKTLSVLEDFLVNYDGCLLVVSHDRYFMDRVCEYLFILKGDGTIDQYPGNYTDFLDYKNDAEALLKKNKKHATNTNTKTTKETKKKLSFNEQREYESIDKEIEKLETEKSKLEETFNSADCDFESDTYKKDIVRHKELQTTIDEKWQRWEYLSEFVG